MRRLTLFTVPCLSLLLLPACGDDGNTGATNGNSDEIGEGIETADSNNTNAEAGSDDKGETAGETSTTDDTGTATAATTANDDDDDDDDGDDGDDGQPKFDTVVVPDGGMANPCGDGMGMMDPEFSYIWVANSGQGTISKLNTVTLVEEGRYQTRVDTNGSPSRTSVSLTGDVAVANRNGGVTKVIAKHENCDEMNNGQPGLQTSSGKDDVLPWGEDDCVAWSTSFDNAVNANRPVAWTSGLLNLQNCQVEEQKVWTSVSNTSMSTSMRVIRLDGDDGSVEADFNVPEVNVGSFGAYGGAVNSENDFWFINYSSPRMLVKVDYETLDYQTWPVPAAVCSYGFTVDSLDRPWIGAFCEGSTMFDPETEEFTVLPGMLGYGLQEDANGVMWLGTFSPPGLRGIDIETLQEVKWIELPTNSSRGVSVDFYGYVWFVDMADSAFRVDTQAETWEIYNQLNGPYTYSDMTGWGLNLTSGGIPAG